MSQNRLLAQVGLVLTTLAWGATFVLVKDSLEYENHLHLFSLDFNSYICNSPLFLKSKKFLVDLRIQKITFGIACGFLYSLVMLFKNFD